MFKKYENIENHLCNKRSSRGILRDDSRVAGLGELGRRVIDVGERDTDRHRSRLLVGTAAARQVAGHHPQVVRGLPLPVQARPPGRRIGPHLTEK